MKRQGVIVAAVIAAVLGMAAVAAAATYQAGPARARGASGGAATDGPGGSGAGARLSSLCGGRAGSSPARVAHVMLIVDENRSYPQVIGNPSKLGDPYINDVLVRSCGVADNYHGFSHPSLPNYLALTSGAAQGIAAAKDCSIIANCPQPQASIFSQLTAAGKSWREYAESMPGNCYPRNSGKYLVRHAPPPYYTSRPVPAQCRTSDVPLGTPSSGALRRALSPTRDGLPAFSFVTPNDCNDMHGCSVTAGDNWLKTWVPLIERSAAYQSGQLVVFITWDEGTGADKVPGEPCWNAAHANKSAYPSCWVPLLVLSPYTPAHTMSSARFSARNVLGTAENLLGVPRLPTTRGYASMRSAFHL